MARKPRRGHAQAAASRTYQSTPAAPEQKHFPARRTTIVKTYSTRKTASARSLRQQTLTQIDYVKQAQADDDDDESALLESPTKPERPKKRRKTLGDTPNSSFHTQTLTQFLSEKGDNDQEDELLQIKDSDEEADDDVWEIPADDDEDELPTLPKPKGSSSSKRKHTTREVKQEEVKIKGKGKGRGKGKGKEVLFAPDPHAPSTPSSKRIKVNLDEVPSSQPTPFTPAFDDQTPLFLKRKSPLGEERSPLKERSTNNAPMATLQDMSKRPRNLVIQDSYSPGSSALFSSSLAGSSPNKKADETPTDIPRREPLAELPIGSYDLGEDADDRFGDQETPTRPRTGSARRVYHEIPDSDAELESVGPSPLKSRSTQGQLQQVASEQESQEVVNTEEVEVYIPAASTPGSVVRIPQTPHKGPGGHSSQRPAPETPVIYTDPNAPPPKTPVIYEDPDPGDQIVEEPPPPRDAVISEELDTADQAAESPRPETPAADEDSASTASESEDGPEPGTPTPVARRVQIQLPPSSAPEEEILRETPRRISPRKRSPQKHSPILQRHSQRFTQARSQYYSQGLESQRVPLDVIRNMGPITDTSDVLVSIHPDPVKDIVAGTKDHEFRSYKFPEGATRLWIYTTRPVGEVRYMARIGPPKKPGDPNSQTGLGNAEFNNGELGNNVHAYELEQVYELNNPVPQKEMKEHGMGDKSPTRYRIVPPAIVGQLLGNLRRALFAEGNELDDDDDDEADGGEEDGLAKGRGGPDLTVSQELEEQIRSDIIGSTQMAPRSSQEARHAPHEEIIPASQEETPRTAVKNVSSASKENETPPTSRRVGTSTFGQPRQDDDVFARPALPHTAAPPPPPGPRFSSRIRSQRSQQQQRQQLQRVPSYGHGNMVRPSQATTASEISSPGGSPSKASSSLLSSVPRPSTSSVPDVLLREFDEDCVGDSSPILFGNGLGTASQLNRMVMQDSLMVDEVRPPPQPVIWDSDEDDGEEEEDVGLPTL